MAENKLVKLTPDDLAELYQYSRKMDELAAQEPEDHAGDDWKAWDAQRAALIDEYGDVYGKFLWSTHEEWREDPTKAADVLKYYLATSGNMDLQMFADDPTALHTQLVAIARYAFMNDKVNREMIIRPPEVRAIDGQQTLVYGVNQAGKKHALVPVTIALKDESGQIKTSRTITTFDDAVFTTVSNMIYQLIRTGIRGPYYITAKDIWRRMNGLDGQAKVTAAQERSVKNSLDKLRFTGLYMDISNEIKAHYIDIADDRLERGVFDGYYLKTERVYFLSQKGKELEGYMFTEELPFLFSYNLAKGHVLLVDYDLLDTTDTTGNEGNTVDFRNYLLREIALMYNHGRDSNRILYDTMYKALPHIGPPSDRVQRNKYTSESAYNSNVRQKAKDDRDKVDALLESWKRKKWIRDYTRAKSGRKNIGVDIVLNPKNYEKIAEK